MAQQEQRPRSWVIAEALRHLLKEGGSSLRSGVMREPATQPTAAAVTEEARERRLQQALQASPEARLAQAEELGALARAARPHRPRHPVIGFDALIDFAAWKAADRLRA
jgi:hypothetical protein